MGSRFRLIELAYSRLKGYGLHTHYILSACEVAYSAYRNKNRRSRPFVRRNFIKITNRSYVLNHLILRIPTRPRHFIHLTLQASSYQLSFLENPAVKRGSITITSSAANIAVSKNTPTVEPRRRISEAAPEPRNSLKTLTAL